MKVLFCQEVSKKVKANMTGLLSYFIRKLQYFLGFIYWGLWSKMKKGIRSWWMPQKKKKKKVTREVVTGCRSRKVCYHLIPCIIFVHGFFSGTPSLKEKMSGKWTRATQHCHLDATSWNHLQTPPEWRATWTPGQGMYARTKPAPCWPGSTQG